MPDLTVYGSDCVVGTHARDCTGQALPDAPFPICLSHAAKVLRYLNDAMPADDSPALRMVRGIEPEFPELSEPLIAPVRGTEVVYYARIGKYMKIGYSKDLGTRIRFYPPDTALLAYEPGTPQLEGQRLRQFQRYLIDRDEWFAPSEELLTHVAEVRRAMPSSLAA